MNQPAIDINALKERTAKAQDVLRAKELEEQRRKQEQEARQQRRDERKALTVIEGIEDRCNKEADVGRDHAIIMSLGYDDFTYNSINRRQLPYIPSALNGAARIVWQFCLDNGLSPTLESWHDGVGINGGYNIVVHW